MVGQNEATKAPTHTAQAALGSTVGRPACLHNLRKGGPAGRLWRQAAAAEVNQEGVPLCGQPQTAALEAHRAHHLHGGQQAAVWRRRGRGRGRQAEEGRSAAHLIPGCRMVQQGSCNSQAAKAAKAATAATAATEEARGCATSTPPALPRAHLHGLQALFCPGLLARQHLPEHDAIAAAGGGGRGAGGGGQGQGVRAPLDPPARQQCFAEQRRSALLVCTPAGSAGAHL